MSDIHALTARLDRLESESAIRRLVAEYCHGADGRDRARFAAVWHEDARWVAHPVAEFVGIEAICDAVAGQWAAFDEMHHWTTNLTLTFDGPDRATGESDVDVSVRYSGDRWYRGGGTYRDVYVRRDGRWAISRRDAVEGFDIDPMPDDT